ANPIAGAGVLVAERLFREQLDRFSSARYLLGGQVDAPELTFDSIFEVESAQPAAPAPEPSAKPDPASDSDAESAPEPN
ncbi:MAG: hypothetical protein ACO2YV_10965, partial [Pseudomonadales bacterium]